MDNDIRNLGKLDFFIAFDYHVMRSSFKRDSTLWNNKDYKDFMNG